MRSILPFTLVFVFISISEFANAQENDTTVIHSAERRGDRYFNNFAYSTAIDYFGQALRSDSARTELKLKIAESYRKLNDLVAAEKWYAEVVKDGDFNPGSETYLHYGQVLSSNQKYDEAKLWFEKYKKEFEKENRIKRKLEGLDHLSFFYKDSSYFQITKVTANGEGPDFSPMWFGDDIVFVTSRSNPYVKSEFSWDKTSFLDLYIAQVNETGDLVNPRPFNSSVNTKYHEGPLAFFDNDQKVVFTRNNYLNKRTKTSSDGITKLELFLAERSGDQWINIQPFQYNNPEFSLGHPTISNDGSKLIFSSDMPGGVGGTDLYISYFKDGTWTTPRNMGDVINTEGNEMFPYLNENILYFSSNGHEGLGGLDVYKTQLANDEPLSVANMGYPISSSNDDFGFIIDKDETHGYFSTNRENKLSDDIYFFTVKKKSYLYVKGMVLDNHSGQLLSGARVYVKNVDGEIVADTLTGPGAEFEFKLSNDSYVLSAEKRGYTATNVETVSGTSEQETIENLKLRLEPPHHVISINIVDGETGMPIPDAIAHVIDKDKNEVVEISLREGIHHEFETKADFAYTIMGSKHGYFNNSIDIAIGYDHEFDTLFFDVPIKKFEIGQAIKIDNIYYDLNKSDIREDAAAELDKLVKILFDNPAIRIELSSHTDSRGSDAYNLTLSQSRAESAVAYVIGRGIDKTRIEARGYGETLPVNECVNGVACSTGKHQDNRRTEFRVISDGSE